MKTRLGSVLFGLACVAAAPSRAAELSAALEPIVAEASARFGLPVSWITSVMHLESGGNARAVSPKGAIGLMQIMPSTWASLRARYGLGADPFDARDNILAGAAYLRELYDRYGPGGFLAAYNAGPKRLEAHLVSSAPLPAETRAYIARLQSMIGGDAPSTGSVVTFRRISWTAAPLFAGAPSSVPALSAAPAVYPPVARSTPSAAHPESSLAPTSAGLFVLAHQ